MQLSKPKFGKERVAFAVQYTSLKSEAVEATVRALKQAGLSSYSIGLIHGSDEISGLEDIPQDIPIIPLGGTKLVSMQESGLLPENWVLYYDQLKFDQMMYVQNMNGQMLNQHAKYYTIQECFALGPMERDAFIKPTSDLKLFVGGIIKKGQNVGDYITSIPHKPLVNLKDVILINHLIKIKEEYRVIVLRDEVVGISRYKNSRGQVVAHKFDPKDMRYHEVLDYVYQHVIPVYNPAPIYTVDIAALHKDTKWDGIPFKIVEYNCFHASGLYGIDRAHVYQSLANFVAHEDAYY